MPDEADREPDDRLTEGAGVPSFLTDPVRRRSWLLAKALASHPLDQALELARSAESFITGSPVAETTTATPLRSDAAPAPEAHTKDNAKPAKRPIPLALAPEKREELLERLAQGTRNAELARDFGLPIRQVQGIRVGSAREIARLRDRAREQG
jgi:hypothetical protein